MFFFEDHLLPYVQKMVDMGYTIYSTPGTHVHLRKHDIPVTFNSLIFFLLQNILMVGSFFFPRKFCSFCVKKNCWSNFLSMSLWRFCHLNNLGCTLNPWWDISNFEMNFWILLLVYTHQITDKVNESFLKLHKIKVCFH